MNRNNVLKVKNKIHKNPEFIHVLKVGLDMESDPMVIDSQAVSLLQSTNEILGDLKNQT